MADAFLWPVSLGSGNDTKTRVKKAQFGDGYAQRTGDGLNPLQQSWQVTVKLNSIADADLCESYLEERAGAMSFPWTPPRATTEIQVICESWSRRDRVNSSVITATFERVYQP